MSGLAVADLSWPWANEPPGTARTQPSGSNARHPPRCRTMNWLPIAPDFRGDLRAAGKSGRNSILGAYGSADRAVWGTDFQMLELIWRNRRGRVRTSPGRRHWRCSTPSGRSPARRIPSRRATRNDDGRVRSAARRPAPTRPARSASGRCGVHPSPRFQRSHPDAGAAPRRLRL